MVDSDPTTPKGLLSFLRGESRNWAQEDVPANAFIEAKIVSTDGTTARIQRNGFDQDQQSYPTVSPYSPRVGDNVLCAVTPGGLYILGALNRNTPTDENVSLYARINDPSFTGNPTAPTPVSWADRSDRIATTSHVKDVLYNIGDIGGGESILTGIRVHTPMYFDDGTGINVGNSQIILSDGSYAVSSDSMNSAISTALSSYITTATANASFLPIYSNGVMPASLFSSGTLTCAAFGNTLTVDHMLAVYNSSHVLQGFIPIFQNRS